MLDGHSVVGHRTGNNSQYAKRTARHCNEVCISVAAMVDRCISFMPVFLNVIFATINGRSEVERLSKDESIDSSIYRLSPFD